MAQRQRPSQKSVSNLSVNFIEAAFLTLIENSLPVYRRNIDCKRPPVAAGENVSAAAAVMMLATGLDYHLCRLKYLRDVARHTPALPHTPYFNWSFDDPLSVKIQRLLSGRKESRLQSQLIELTVCRDAIVHPKFYTITHSWAGVEFSDGTMTAELPPGVGHRKKTVQHKMQRREFSRTLKLPLVPTWVSYVDAVVCILVLYRLLSFLESRYGNPYAWIGGITAYEGCAKGLFTGWDWTRSHPQELEDWAQAFFLSLSPADQAKIASRLRGNITLYTRKKKRAVRVKTRKRRSSLGMIFREKVPPKLDFLSKPPPW
jgi:hypothetical protein